MFGVNITDVWVKHQCTLGQTSVMFFSPINKGVAASEAGSRFFAVFVKNDKLSHFSSWFSINLQFSLIFILNLRFSILYIQGRRFGRVAVYCDRGTRTQQVASLPLYFIAEAIICVFRVGFVMTGNSNRQVNLSSTLSTSRRFRSGWWRKSSETSARRLRRARGLPEAGNRARPLDPEATDLMLCAHHQWDGSELQRYVCVRSDIDKLRRKHGVAIPQSRLCVAHRE